MTQNQFIISKFLKKRAVIIYIRTEDKRLIKRWAIPKGGTVSLKGIGKVELNDEGMILSNNIPTYIYSYGNTEPINLDTNQTTKYDPVKYDVAMETKVLKEFLKSFEATPKISPDTIIIVGSVLLSALGVAYYISSEIAKIYEMLSSLGIGVSG